MCPSQWLALLPDIDASPPAVGIGVMNVIGGKPYESLSTSDPSRYIFILPDSLIVIAI